MDPDPKFWRGRSVAVTGGTGFLGWHLVHRLAGLGARVRALALPPRPDHPVFGLPAIAMLPVDICDTAATQRALSSCEVVFHTAGVVAVWGPGLAVMDSVHGRGTANVLAGTPPTARVVHTSSVVT